MEPEKRSLTYPLIVISFFILFQQKSHKIISNFLVDPLFSSVKEENYLLDTCFYVFIIALIYVFINHLIRDFRAPRSLFWWSVVLTIIYTFYRWNEKEYKFLKLKTLWLHQHLAYTDILLFTSGAIILYRMCVKIKLYYQKDNVELAKDGFWVDNPISLNDAKSDIFSRREYVEELKLKILATNNFDNSFAIAVIGSWGSGKTTFILTLEDSLRENNKIIQLKFNPWTAGSPEKIIELFFSDLSSILGKYDGNLKDQILSYSKELMKSLSSITMPSIKELFQSKSPNTPTYNQYINISKTIKALKKRIIIYIDDVDRLDKKEIMEVLRLIRNTANFSNTYFVVTFDRTFLVSSINAFLDGSKEAYIEKIFQLEYYLPITKDKKVMEKFFYDALKEYVEEKNSKTIEVLYDPNKADLGTFEFNPLIIKYLSNIRDIKRLLNVILLNYKRVRHNVYLPDYIAVSILKLKYPEVYYELYYNKFVYLHEIEVRNFNDDPPNRLVLNYEKVNEVDKGKVSNDITDTVLYKKLNDNLQSFSLNKSTVNDVADMVFHIFSNERVKHLWHRTLDNFHLSVTHSSYFERYFDSYLEGRLNQEHFQIAFSGDIEAVKKFILDSVSSNLLKDLKHTLETIRPSNRNEYEKLIKGIIYFANLPSPEDPDEKVQFDLYLFSIFLFRQIGSYNTAHEKYYEGDEKKFIHFLWSLYNDPVNKDATFHMFRFGLYMAKSQSDKFYIPYQELIKWCEDTFEKLIKQNSKVTSTIYLTFEELIKIYKQEDQTKKDRIISTFKDFIQEDFVGFLRFLTPICSLHKDQGGRQLFDVYKKIYGSADEFLKVVRDQNENIEACHEFIDFYNQFISKESKECLIGFHFRYLHKD